MRLPAADARQRARPSHASAARLEVLPLDSVEQQLASLPAGAPIALTCAPRHGIDHTLRFAERWAARGVHVVPHLAARHVENPAHVARIAAGVPAPVLVGASTGFIRKNRRVAR